MKTFFAIIGGIAALIFLALVAAFVFAFTKLGPLQNQATIYAEETIIAVATDWDSDELLARVSDKFLEYTPPGAIEGLMADGSRQVGGMTSLGDFTCNTRQFVTTANGKITSSECTGSATHERGTADYRMGISMNDGVWVVDGFFVTANPNKGGPVPV